jgi:hypothetical protein
VPGRGDNASYVKVHTSDAYTSAHTLKQHEIQQMHCQAHTIRVDALRMLC